MHRPDALSNVVMGYREGSDEFVIAYTDSKPIDKTLVPKTDEDINVHVYGLTHVDANIYAHEDVLVDGNVYVSGNTSVTEELTVSGNVYADKDLEVMGNTYVDGNVVAYKDLLVSGNVYVSQNVSVTEELTVTGNVYADKDLEVIGNVYVDGNVVAYKDLLVSGNVYVSQNVSVTEELTVTGNVYADKDLEVMGNTYVDGNVVAYKDFTLTGNAYVSGNVEVTKALIVSANTHLKGDNVFVTHTMDFLDPTTAIVTDQISNVQIRLGQLENVANTVSNPLINQVLTYDQDNSEWSNAYPDQTIVLVKNTSGAPMTRGQAVYVTGSNGNNTFQIELADASDPTKMPAIGIVYEDIPINGQGAVVTFGRANGISGISGYTNGDTLYVASGTPGGLTNVKPYGVDLDLIQNIGVIVNHNSGVMFVTGIGRSNDIPNARIITDYNAMQYVYVNSENNDLKKITSANLNIPLTTAVSSSSNSTANAVTLRGVSITSGDGFHGDLVVAGNVAVDTNTLKVDAEANRVGILTASPGQTLDVRGAANVGTFTTTTGTVTDGTHSTSKDTGVLVLTQGGLGVEANIHSTNVFAASHIAVGTSDTSNTFDVRGTANVGALVATSTHISDSTATTSKTTGALQVTGGVGIQGDIHATHANLEDLEADSVTVTDATAATDKTSGALQVAGGVGVQGDLYATNGVFTTNVYIADHSDLNNKYLAMIDTNGSLIQSPVYVAPSGKYVISAAEAEFLGNITLGGNTTLLTSTSLVVEDRIIGIGSNNSAEGLDSGIIIEHQDEGVFANIALIHHADEHRFSIGYTQNTLSDNHILHASHPDDVILQIDLNGNTLVENSLSVYEMATFGTKVGIATTEPIANIHVVGNAFVSSNITTSSNVIVNGDAAATSKTTGALQVAGGIGVQGDIYGVTLYTDDYLTHIGDTNTKIGFPANDTFTVTTSGTERVRVDSSGDVGIGTANPSHLLELYGDNSGGILKIGNNTSYTRWNNGGHHIDVYNSSDNTGRLLYLNYYSQGGVRIDNNLGVNGYSGTDNLYVVGNARVTSDFEVGEVANLYVDTETSRVGINTDSPAYNLDVRGTSNVGVFTTPDASVTDSTASSSKTSGALKVTGGVGVSGALYGAAATFDGVTSVTNATASTSKTSGALKVTGGVGISGDIHATHANLEDVEADSVTVTDATQATDTLTGALTVAGGLSTQTNVHAANVYISGGLITNTAGVTKKTYAYSGTIADTEQPYINVCFTNESFSAKIDAQLIEGDDEISTISLVCCGGNKGGTFPASDIQVGSVQVFGPASTNPWSSTVVGDKTTVALRPSAAIDTSGEYHIFVEYLTAKSAGAVANVVQDTTEKIVFGY